MKFAIYLVAGIGLGLGVAYWQFGGNASGGLDTGLVAADQGLELRIRELETALSLERYERQALADALADLELMVADIEFAAGAEGAAASAPRERIAALIESGDGVVPEQLRQRFADRFLDDAELDQRQIERFIDAGLSPEQAQRIVDRQDALEMEVLQARYEATQNGASAAEVANLSVSRLMREELGDDNYARYLEGLGRPTSVNVREVLTNSPARFAGIEAGDQIIAYDGQRVFDMNELNSMTYDGKAGETVAIDVMRDGQQLRLYVERGPIGISGGGRSVRRRR